MKFNLKKLAIFAAVAMGIGTAVWVFSMNGESFKKINTTAENIAVKGYDAVAYFASARAVEGSPQFSLVWNGAKWYFSSAENMERFKNDPDSFAPQFGGYCSYAVAHGYTADGDPEAWKIVDGKLYLNYNRDVRTLWEKEEANYIREGGSNWNAFQTKMPEHKGAR